MVANLAKFREIREIFFPRKFLSLRYNRISDPFPIWLLGNFLILKYFLRQKEFRIIRVRKVAHVLILYPQNIANFQELQLKAIIFGKFCCLIQQNNI